MMTSDATTYINFIITSNSISGCTHDYIYVYVLCIGFVRTERSDMANCDVMHAFCLLHCVHLIPQTWVLVLCALTAPMVIAQGAGRAIPIATENYVIGLFQQINPRIVRQLPCTFIVIAFCNILVYTFWQNILWFQLKRQIWTTRLMYSMWYDVSKYVLTTDANV